ncbi:MAG TPA: L-threonylcarbamoyladenylate synthase [Dehalococcoidales bacterium]|nr:L-threonylcarbamoyladenylate synthase [Dehalococcoidales bacterium]
MKAKVEKIDAARPDKELLERAARLINGGEVVVCPTDTGYAFSANALDTRAIAKVFHLKGRSYSNPIHVAVSSIEEAGKYAYVDDTARYIAGHYLPGALTLVLRKKEIVPPMLVAGLDTIGIRIPDNRVILRLVEMTGHPLTTTSANISGRPGAYSAEEVLAQLGENIREVALILDQGPVKTRELSTIVDLTVSPPQLIRQGRVSWLELREVLKRFQNPGEKG